MEIKLIEIDQPVHAASPHAHRTIYKRDDGSDRLYVLLPICKAKIKTTGLFCTRSAVGEDFCRGHT